MRSSSSELLLDQQQELRKRKLLELAKPKKPVKVKRTWRQRIWFYATSLLALTAMSAGSSLLFLVPLYVDPALSTLTHRFVDVPVTCTTTRREDLSGIFNCTWSSCREGCTSDMYKCTHIFVSYSTTPHLFPSSEVPSSTFYTTDAPSFPWTSPTTPSGGNSRTSPSLMSTGGTHTRRKKWAARPLTTTSPSLVTALDDSNFTEEAVLYVNIKGCGYPPDVQCGNFTAFFGYKGVSFPCYYSRLNRSVVMSHYSKDDQVAVIVHYFAIPFVLTVVTSVILCVMHCDCRCEDEERRRYHHHHHSHHRGMRTADNSDCSISTRVDMFAPSVEASRPL